MFFDHTLISFELELTKVKLASSRYMVNCAYLKDPLVIANLHKQWQPYSVQTSFFDKIYKITKWYRLWCWRKAQDRRAKEMNL